MDQRSRKCSTKAFVMGAAEKDGGANLRDLVVVGSIGRDSFSVRVHKIDFIEGLPVDCCRFIRDRRPTVSLSLPMEQNRSRQCTVNLLAEVALATRGLMAIRRGSV